MSWVANVMLSVALRDRENAKEFGRWLEEDCPRRDPRTQWTGCGDLAPITDPNNHNWAGTSIRSARCTPAR